MKYIFNNRFSIALSMFLFVGMMMPKQEFAQRFSHSSGGGGGFQAPREAPRASTPQPVRQAQQAPARRVEAAPAAQENRVSINGGSRNFGNHDFNHQPAMREVDHPVDYDRGHINVFHGGDFRGAHPYAYHPYQPFYWGPRWHPLGFFLSSLAANAIRLYIGGQYYFYSDGCYYSPYNGGYSVVAPPYGAIVSYLPDEYETVPVGNGYYYYYGGYFYVQVAQGYQMVQAPIGAIVSQIPVGAIQQNINGEDLLVFNNTYFAPISENGQDAYQVVQ